MYLARMSLAKPSRFKKRRVSLQELPVAHSGSAVAGLKSSRIVQGVVMAKQADAKRRAKLKERRKRVESAVSRVSSNDPAAQAWFAAFDAEPYVVVSLLDSAGVVIAQVEGDSDGEDWTVVVDGVAVAGTDDEIVALALILSVSTDRHPIGLLLQFSPWMTEKIERRCEDLGMRHDEFLSSLLPPERRVMALPPVTLM